VVHTPEECQSIFVSWKWLITILTAALAGVASITWAGSRVVAENDLAHNLNLADHAIYQHRMDLVEQNGKKLDHIIEILSKGAKK
jgi:hypothetical protein